VIAISELVRGETVVSDEVVASVQQFDLIKVQVEHEQSILEGMPLRSGTSMHDLGFIQTRVHGDVFCGC